MAIQPTTDAPFGLQPNVAAGIAWIFGIIGGLIMLFGGGTNRFVKHAAAQSITLGISCIVVSFAILAMSFIMHFLFVFNLLLALIFFVVAIYGTVMGFMGKDVSLPVVDQLAEKIFASQL